MAGKLAKLAAGVMMTHWTRSKVDNELLADVTTRAGGSVELIEEVKEANTARHAYELWRAAELAEAPNLLCALAAENLREYAEGRLGGPRHHGGLRHFGACGASPGALALTARRDA
jgi:cobalt-precorrin-5B (C1)-methyltransferase